MKRNGGVSRFCSALYPGVFPILEREPRTGKPRLIAAFYLSQIKIKIIVSLLPPAGLFIFL